MCMKIPWKQGKKNDTDVQLGSPYIAKNTTISLAVQSSEIELGLYFRLFKRHFTVKEKLYTLKNK